MQAPDPTKTSLPKNPRRWPQFYWFWFQGEGLPVHMPALASKPHFRWRGLFGIQIGRWFFGAIEGGPGSPWTEPPSRADTPAAVLDDLRPDLKRGKR